MMTETGVDTSKGFYLDLEQELHVLITHFSMCYGATDPEVLDWARYFEHWAESASWRCGAWSKLSLEKIRNFVRYLELEGSRTGHSGYVSLRREMGEASRNLNKEIRKNLQPPKQSQESRFYTLAHAGNGI
jgi:hypothetical protein